ncbi:speckle-type POZ protein B [Caerostris darwini]|uniref:Speckle-type POZ protein B n=1 Tax=Caerostris darwini TaxID=1538125 RepID=A0AAV4QAB7_9ARAC|nr:speckle-type POZ protein B [Caerostris darwini]
MEVSKGKEFVFTWTIENFSFCIQSCQNWFESPPLIARNMENSRWIILLYPRGIIDENYISVYLKHVDGNLSGQKISFEFQLIGFNDSVRRDVHLCQKNVLQGFPLFLLRDAIGMNKRNRDFYLPHDTFRLRCRLWYSGTEIVEYGQCSAKTLMGVERLCLVWDLQEFSTLRADLKKTLPFTSSSACPLVSMSLFWTYKIYFTDELTVEIAVKTAVNTVCSCKISNVAIEGKTIPLIETEKYFYLRDDVQIWSLPPLFSKRHLMTRKDAYLSNGTLSLKCEFTFSTGYLTHGTLETYNGPKIFHSVGEDFHNVNCPNFVKAESMNELKNDLEFLYTKNINCDVNLRIESEHQIQEKIR